MLHGSHALRYQSLLKMISSNSTKKRRANCSSVEVDESITKIQTGDISHPEAVLEYRIMRQTLARKFRKKIYNVSDKRPGTIPVLGEAPDKDLVKWDLAMNKQILPVGQDKIIHKASEIHHYMFCYLHALYWIGWLDMARPIYE